jgi:hypothetical protein
MTPLNRKLLILFIILGIAGMSVAILYVGKIYDFRYNPPPGAGICYHTPQEIISHTFVQKEASVYSSYYYH